MPNAGDETNFGVHMIIHLKIHMAQPKIGTLNP